MTDPTKEEDFCHTLAAQGKWLHKLKQTFTNLGPWVHSLYDQLQDLRLQNNQLMLHVWLTACSHSLGSIIFHHSSWIISTLPGAQGKPRETIVCPNMQLGSIPLQLRVSGLKIKDRPATVGLLSIFKTVVDLVTTIYNLLHVPQYHGKQLVLAITPQLKQPGDQGLWPKATVDHPPPLQHTCWEAKSGKWQFCSPKCETRDCNDHCQMYSTGQSGWCQIKFGTAS